MSFGRPLMLNAAAGEPLRLPENLQLWLLKLLIIGASLNYLIQALRYKGKQVRKVLVLRVR